MTRAVGSLDTASTALLVASAALLPTSAALSLKPRLLAAASSFKSSIFRLAPCRCSRKLEAPWSNQRPIDSKTPGFSCCAGCCGASCAATADASSKMPTAPAAATQHFRVQLSVLNRRIGFVSTGSGRLAHVLPSPYDTGLYSRMADSDGKIEVAWNKYSA